MYSDKREHSSSFDETMRIHVLSDVFLRVFILAIPFAAIVGNAMVDAWVVTISFGFLVSSAIKRNWPWLMQRWLLLALAFWAWAMLCSFASAWPGESLNDSAAWLRFPIFAAGLAEILGRTPQLQKQFALSMMVAVTLVALYILIARFTNTTAERISGPLGMERPGWYLLGFGLPTVLLARHAILAKLGFQYAMALLIVVVLAAILASYQIYVTFALLLGLMLCSGLTATKGKVELAMASLVLLTIILVLTQSSVLLERYSNEVLRGLPWQESSRYYNFWAGGLRTAFDNLVSGVGPDNYDTYCRIITETEGLAGMGFSPANSIDGCDNHPHQRYIQIAAETGLPGLLLFLAMVSELIGKAIRACYHDRTLFTTNAMALALLIVNFWPLSTYSEAFGQKLNFFYWLHVGWALALLRTGSATRGRFDWRNLTLGAHRRRSP